jgi:citrate lyase subunit beta/citryl-CoA lyase
MPATVHPRDALFAGEKPFPVVPACEHFAGSERLITKALDMQEKLGAVFDITCDCEDGAEAGKEKPHAEMIVDILHSPSNRFAMAGARIHDYTHPHWKKDVDILVGGAGKVIAYVTIPKCTSVAQAEEMIGYIQAVSKKKRFKREIPVHVLIETHGALHDAWEIAQLPGVQVLDFGLMDFVSGHHGAISATNMRSPGQFEHPLVARAKADVVAAALANGVVPAHNVSLDLRNAYNVFRDAWRARTDFGFLRMWSIHPSQVQPIVDAMKPDLNEVAVAGAILLEAQQAKWGPIQFDGELHDRATYRYFWEVLQKARVTGVKMPEEASRAFFD